MARVKGSPIVSVIIPTYNRAHFIGETIRNVLNQTYRDFELIVVDDGSTDNTKEVVNSFNDDRLRYIRLERNSGTSAVPRNTGLRAARGEYIAFLDSDDIWLPNKLEAEVGFLDTHPLVGMVYSNYTYFGSRATSKRTGFEGVSLASGHVLKELFLSNPIISSAVLVRKSCFDKVGLFDESLVQWGDHDMWLRIAAYFQIDYIDIPLARYRLHDRNRHLESETMLTGHLAMRRKWLKANFLSGSESDRKAMCKWFYRVYRGLGIYCLDNNSPQRAREVFSECLKLCPRDPIAYLLWLITFLSPRLVSWIRTSRSKLRKTST